MMEGVSEGGRLYPDEAMWHNMHMHGRTHTYIHTQVLTGTHTRGGGAQGMQISTSNATLLS